MKQRTFIITIIALLATVISASAQKQTEANVVRDQSGQISSVEYSLAKKSAAPQSADQFFKDVLKIKANDEFKPNEEVVLSKGNETFNQYYKGLPVDEGCYTIHYDESGNMTSAHGNYIDCGNLDTTPSLSQEEAKDIFAKYMDISVELITGYTANLMVKQVMHDTDTIVALTYRVELDANCPQNTDAGYVDAKTGTILETESYSHYADATSPTSTFHTKYQGTVYARTNYSDGKYSLKDFSRPAYLYTYDYGNRLFNGDENFLGDATIPEQTSNIWSYTNYTDSTFMALDVFWALQKIYDRLYTTYGKNSFNNKGMDIISYVKTLFPSGGIYPISNITTSDGAKWDSQYRSFFFGAGTDWVRPFSSVDIVAHEYGHAITQYQIGWKSNSVSYLNEGISDIWAVIMNYHFGPSGKDIWRFAEKIYSKGNVQCLRNFRDTQDTHAYRKIDNYYNPGLYNGTFGKEQSYARSGVFSHWFYLLVNGMTIKESDGTSFQIEGVGMDLAEQLIVKAVYDGYLRSRTNYEQVRAGFISAANNMGNPMLAYEIAKAWHAVGVGSLPALNLTMKGPSKFCLSAEYAVQGMLNGCTIKWSLPHPSLTSSCLTPNAADNTCLVQRPSTSKLEAELKAKIMYNGKVVETLTKNIYAYPPFSAKLNQSAGSSHGAITNQSLTKGAPFSIYRGIPAIVTSPNFKYMDIPGVYTSTGGEPVSVSYDGDETMRLYFSNDYKLSAPLVVNVKAPNNVDDCNAFQMTVFPLSSSGSYAMSISSENGSLEVALEETQDEVAEAFAAEATVQMATQATPQEWTLEVYSGTTGKKILSQKQTDMVCSVNTSGWTPGIYVVRAAIGEDMLYEKITIK